MSRFSLICAAVAGGLLLAGSGRAPGQDCDATSTGLVPINDLGAGLYLGLYQGGLYPNGLNVAPAVHQAEGLSRAAAIEPLDANGLPAAGGKYVLLSIGMSNVTQEYCSQESTEPCDPWTFTGQALASSAVNHGDLAIINGAAGGQAAASWESPTDPNYDRILNGHLSPKGLTEAQVVAVWIKQANPAPSVSLPNAAADAFGLLASLGNIVRAVKVRYPKVQIVFLSSRIYGGYAGTNPLNPEPYAYEGGFSAKWLIEAQIDQIAGSGIDPLAGDLDYGTVAPWLAWGPYLWADGLLPRSDGLIWECVDFEADGTHPSMSGEQKVGTMLLDFMMTSSFSQPWFAVPAVPGDCNGNGTVTLDDLNAFTQCLGGPGVAVAGGCDCADFDDDGDADLADFSGLQLALGPASALDPAFDDFERATLGGNWTVSSGSPGIVAASDLGAMTSGVSVVAWTGSTFGNDQFCEGALAAGWNPNDTFQISVRFDLATQASYSLRWTGGGGVFELRADSGASGQVLASTSSVALAPGDTLRIEAQGGTIRALLNASIFLTASDFSLTSGAASVAFAPLGTTPAPYLESWRGGSL